MFNFSDPNLTQRQILEAVVATLDERLGAAQAELDAAEITIAALGAHTARQSFSVYRDYLFAARNALVNEKTQHEVTLAEWAAPVTPPAPLPAPAPVAVEETGPIDAPLISAPVEGAEND